jgi:hypothetical protein
MTTKINSFKRDERSDYKLIVNYDNKDYLLNFKSAAFDDCFEHQSREYKKAKAGENETAIVDSLNSEKDFLKVIGEFLESRFELGRKEIAYNLSIRHADADYNSRLYTDDKVYRFGNCQICEDILKRWFLKSVSNSGENDFSLTFNHSLNQRESVSFMVSRPALERIMSGTIDYEKLIEQINGDASRLQFSIACDLVNQSFKSKNLPEPITEQNWNEFYSDPKGFVTSSFNMPA